MSRGNKGFTVIELIVVVIIIAVIAIAAITTFNSNRNQQVVTATVNNKERVNQGETSKYLIYTNMGVFENTDNAFHGKYNSSDFYNNIKKDSTYEFTLIGYRVPSMSMYQNIIEYRKVQ